MLKKLFLLSCCILTACSSFNSSDSQEDKKKIDTAKINTQLGLAYLQRNEISRAKQKLLLALDEAPNLPETNYSMAYFLEVTGNKEESNTYYLKAISIAPERGDTHNNYGTFLCRSGHYEASIQQFLLATRDPNYLDTAAAYENAGFCSLKIPDKQQAKMYFSKAIEQDPTRNSSSYELSQLKKEGIA